MEYMLYSIGAFFYSLVVLIICIVIRILKSEDFMSIFIDLTNRQGKDTE